MPRPIPITRDLVLLGGGHTHALVLRKWAMNPLPGAQVTLVNPQPKAPYTGMLPGFIAGHYERDELDIDLVRLARQAKARLIIDYAVGIDTVRKRVQLSQRPEIAYDTLSVDIGITSGPTDLSGSRETVIPAKPLGPFADAWEAMLLRCTKEHFTPGIAIIGGGIAGVELALSMAHRLDCAGVEGRQIRLIEAAPYPLGGINNSARRNLISELARNNVEIITDAFVEEVTPDGLRLGANEAIIPANFIVSAAGAKPHTWLNDTNLALEGGYIIVDKQLQSIDTPNVFAAGDCAHLSYAPRPKAGVFAVRQAPVLFHNLRADLSKGRMKNYTPQKSYLKLISKGRKSAVTDKWGFALSGSRVWDFKNRIDQAFMEQFRARISMPEPELPCEAALGVKAHLEQNALQCGGCGSKVGQAPLLEGLGHTRDAALDDAAIIERNGRTEVFTTDHLRAFTPDLFLMGRVAAIHALGDIWAMGAKPETILANIILPEAAPPQQANMIREIMAGASQVFEACGTNVSGGHTSSGAELTIGFSIAGVAPQRPVKQSGAKSGDILVLTKPIGTGVILAAEMQQEADGGDYQAALASMCRLQARAANILAKSATAMTDVTGFGLAGHLLNLLDASDISARLELNRIPILPGVEALSAKGIRSSLWLQNTVLKSRVSVSESAHADLLFDPQTCGGLLASIPQAQLDQLISDFEAIDEPIWSIGEVVTSQKLVHVEVVDV